MAFSRICAGRMPCRIYGDLWKLTFESRRTPLQVFVAQEEILIKRTGGGRQHLFPIHRRDLTAATACEQSSAR